MNIKTLFAVLTIVIPLGCEQQAQNKVMVDSRQYDSGYYVSDVPVMTLDGRYTSLDSLRRSVGIVSFTTADADGNWRTNPALSMLCNDSRLANLPVTVIQVVVPAENMKTVAAMTESAPGKVAYDVSDIGAAKPIIIPSLFRPVKLITIYDPHGLVEKAYGHPRPNEVLLVDWENRVIETASTYNLGRIPDQAQKLGREMYNAYMP
jgi:hypothetical protein